MIDAHDADKLMSELIRKAWLPWIGLALVSGLFGTLAWRYRHADKPLKMPNGVAVRPSDASSDRLATPTVVYEAGVRLPDGFRVSVVGKRIEFVGNPENLVSRSEVSYESIQDVATACELIVAEAYEKERLTPRKNIALRSSAGNLVTPRDNSVFVRMEFAGRSVEDYVDVPVSPNGRNRLWGLAVKLVDMRVDSVVKLPAGMDSTTPSAEPLPEN
jgi:hypothetical protein